MIKILYIIDVNCTNFGNSILLFGMGKRLL